MDEETALRCAGVDAVIYLRAMKLGITIFSLFVAVGFGLLLPVNLSCSKWEDGDESSKYYDLNLFMQCTLSNVPAKDRRLWAHSAASYLLTFITMHLLAKENRAYAKMRHRFLSSKTVNLRTILVERIPRDLRSNSRLKAYFNAMYPGKVYDVHLSQDLSPLEKLLQKRNHILCQLERCIMKKHLTGLEPQHSPHPFCCFGGLIDSIPYYSNLLQHLNAAVSKGQVHRISTMAARDHVRAAFCPSTLSPLTPPQAARLPLDHSRPISAAAHTLAGKRDRHCTPVRRAVFPANPEVGHGAALGAQRSPLPESEL